MKDLNKAMQRQLEDCEKALSEGILSIIEALNGIDDARRNCERPKVKEVIYSPPVTAVVWSDGKVTRTRCQKDDTYDREKGLLFCLVKRAYPDWYETMREHGWANGD